MSPRCRVFFKSVASVYQDCQYRHLVYLWCWKPPIAVGPSRFPTTLAASVLATHLVPLGHTVQSTESCNPISVRSARHRKDIYAAALTNPATGSAVGTRFGADQLAPGHDDGQIAFRR